jgi:hypothetical protein
MNCEDYFEFFNEKEYTSSSFESFKAKSDLTEEEKLEVTKDFNETHKDGENPEETFMMAMYMVGALQYFENKSNDEIKGIAFEIAMLGCGGISPQQKNGYKVNSIPEKDFGGYELLAFYYVSWAIAIPEQLNALNLPFKEAYKMAKELYKAKKS